MELTLDQAREVARLRRRWPSAEVVLHHRAHGLIVELRRHGRTVEIRRFAVDGSVAAEQPIAA
jgi:hypothetical protein